MSARATPSAKRSQRHRRKLRRLAANLCLHGLCCPNPANTPAERVEQARAEAGVHTLCPTHRTRAGRRSSKPQA